jgi:alkanesulfonate monooxygenase SsuD/methylene tetrahydromethanopterin reductase-like flavin-dependent oxidoreductase (luciferase family)
MWKRNDEQADEDCNLDYFIDEIIIAGDPDHVASRIDALREEVGDFGTLVLVAHDWDDRDSWLRSLELFSREVVPLLG